MAKVADPKEIDRFVFDHVEEHPELISKLLAEKFGVSRQASNAQLRRLVRSGALESAGQTRSRRYSLAKLAHDIFAIPITPELEEHEVWNTRVRPLLEGVPANVISICNYGFTEMLNNAKDHSESSKVLVCVERTVPRIRIWVQDQGIGVFRKIREALGLEDDRHAILELVKGKFTTDPTRHTGEGVFFTSRMFDKFWIGSGQLCLIHIRAQEDWLIEDKDIKPGTGVILDIDPLSEHTDTEVFRRYATEQDDYAFRRTHVVVELAQSAGEGLVSRSQAKRLMFRLERFREVVLDFRGIPSVGPAFADEVFRVFQTSHPNTSILVVNASDEVRLMIDRARSAAAEAKERGDAK